jgi:hypothetical protein
MWVPVPKLPVIRLIRSWPSNRCKLAQVAPDQLWSNAMTSTAFLASRKSRIVLVGSAIIGAAALLLGHLLERLKTKSSEPNPWAPYFARERAFLFHPASLFVYFAVCAAIVSWSCRPPAHKGQENTKLALMAMIIISLEGFLTHWIFGY